MFSDWWPVTGGVLQTLVLGALLFDIYINNLYVNVGDMVSMFGLVASYHFLTILKVSTE